MARIPKNHPVIGWIQQNCRHPRAAGSRLHGQKIQLMDFQKQIIADCFGQDGFAKRQHLVIIGPRKCAKSSLAAAIIVYLVAGPKSGVGQNIPIAAAGLGQGRVLFGLCQDMIAMLNDATWKVRKDETENTISGNKVWMASQNWRGLYSHIPTTCAIEEVAMHQSEKPILSITSGMASAQNPLTIWLSNPPPTLDHPFFYDRLKHWRGQKRSRNPDYSVWIFSAPKGADPFSLETVKRANPAFSEGKIGNEKFFKDQIALARTSPEKLIQFRQLVLGQFVASPGAEWINGKNWRIFQRAKKPGRLFIGADFSISRDKSAVVYAERIEGAGWYFHCDAYLPEAALEHYSEQRRNEILEHSEKGWIKVQKGHRVTDTRAILKDCLARIKESEGVEAFSVDPNAGGAPFIAEVEAALPIEVYPASSYPKALTAPINLLSRIDGAGEFLYDGNGQLLDSFRQTLLTSRQSRNYKSVCRKHEGPGYSIDPTVACLYALQSYCNEKKKEYFSPMIV